MKQTTTSMSWISLYWILLLEQCPESEPLKESTNFTIKLENVNTEIYLKHEYITNIFFPKLCNTKTFYKFRYFILKKFLEKHSNSKHQGFVFSRKYSECIEVEGILALRVRFYHLHYSLFTIISMCGYYLWNKKDTG